MTRLWIRLHYIVLYLLWLYATKFTENVNGTRDMALFVVYKNANYVEIIKEIVVD